LQYFAPPKDPARNAIAKKLAEIAFDFMVAHEFSHIANGHVDYYNSRFGLSCLDEIGGSRSDERNMALACKTMEMDADASAVQQNLGDLWNRMVGIPRPESNP
jgi:hypothetical protein